MYSVFVLVVTACLISLALTPLVRNLAIAVGFVDRPDAKRKLHHNPVPRVGGVAIAAAYLAAFGLVLLTPLHGSDLLKGGIPFALRLVPALLAIFAAGLIDDILQLTPLQKLAAQLVACGLAIAGGVEIHQIGAHFITPWIGLPLTIVWLLTCSNAFNLIDGVDGLAAGLGLLATTTIAVIALIERNYELAFATVPLVGAILGFLRYNFSPATIFLGDSGSLLIGFMLGCFGAVWSRKSATLVGVTAPLMTLAIPLLDTTLAVCRRLLLGKPIFGADRGHIHHRLLDRGLTPRRVALILYAFCGLAACLSFLQFFARGSMAIIIVILFVTATWIGLRQLRYIEFTALGRVFTTGAFTSLLDTQVSLSAMEVSLSGATTAAEYWSVLSPVTRQFGFTYVRLVIFDEEYQLGERAQNGWRVRIQVTPRARVYLEHVYSSRLHTMNVADLAEVIHTTMRDRLPWFERRSAGLSKAADRALTGGAPAAGTQVASH